MKKTLIIALCCMALSFTACNKPDNPTPVDPVNPADTVDTVDYSEKYVGNYVGPFNFSITTVDGQSQSPWSFEMDNIGMVITKGSDDNAITATVTIDDVTRQTTGIAKKDKADFDFVHLGVNKPDQGYCIELDFQMVASKVASDTLNITGTFTNGTGWIIFMGQTLDINNAEGTLSGTLVKQ